MRIQEIILHTWKTCNNKTLLLAKYLAILMVIIINQFNNDKLKTTSCVKVKETEMGNVGKAFSIPFT